MKPDEVVNALRACNRTKGHRCSECPVLGRYNHRMCKSAVDKFAADHIESLQAELAKYEDSNLTPAEVAELAQAKADGRVVVLPVSVGDTVYRACGLNVIDWTIERIVIFTDEIIFIDDSDNDFKTGDIGKTVFLTREEAEKALKECEK